MGSRTRTALIGLLALSLAGGAATAATVRQPLLPRVALIGDSVPAPIRDVAAARATLGQGVDLDLQVAPCRKVDEESCPFDDARPPNLVQLVQTLGSSLAPTVIVSVGYNDDAGRYAESIEHALDAMRAAGVTRVLWATLKADGGSYAAMNDTIRSAAAKHPELAVVDWNGVAQQHPEWFQPDGLHPNDEGAIGMAQLFHDALDRLGIPVVTLRLRVTTTSLPSGRVGGAYAVTLHATGGAPPYRWSLGAAAPPGLHLAAAGRLTGVPRTRAADILLMRVTDSSGASSTVRLPIRIRGVVTR